MVTQRKLESVTPQKPKGCGRVSQSEGCDLGEGEGEVDAAWCGLLVHTAEAASRFSKDVHD